MVEEIKKEEPLKTEDKPKEELIKTVERLEKANAEMKELLERNEKLAARNLLGGVTQNPPMQQPKEETPTEYVRRLEKGQL